MITVKINPGVDKASDFNYYRLKDLVYSMILR